LIRSRRLRLGRGIGIACPYCGYEGVRTDRYLYTEWTNGDRELYDLRRDPGQLHSRDGEPGQRRRVRDLHALVARLTGCAGRSCRAGVRARLRVRCERDGIVAALAGPGAKKLVRARFFAGGRAIGTGKGKTLERPVKAGRARGKVIRVIATARDGRIASDRKAAPNCR
jgi:hypothetical protein